VPELPEVETVKRTLNTLLKDKVITDVTIRYAPMIAEDINHFKAMLKGHTIHEIKRTGKYLLFDLGEHYLLSHLRMEGKYFIKPTNAPFDKHEHVIFYLEDGETLRYHDVRKFGTMTLRDKATYKSVPPLSLLAKEPIDPTVDGTYIKHKLNNTQRYIKTALLDQHILSGLGNIYVDETLHCASIHPMRRGDMLKKNDYEIIAQCARKVLEKAIELGGSSIRSYTDSLGVSGRFQNELNVHLQKDQSCKTCGTIIEKIKVNGRGTYYCPTCQNR